MNAIAEEGMYSKDAPLMTSMLSLLHTVTKSVTAVGNVVNVKANVALDLVSTAVGYHPELATDENNYLISTLVNKEDIAAYAEVAQSNLNAVMKDGATPSIANVSALAASIETLASMSGALFVCFFFLLNMWQHVGMSVLYSHTDLGLPPLSPSLLLSLSPSLPLFLSSSPRSLGALDATATDVVLSTQILTMCKSALPILQKCEASKNQEKAESCVLDLIGRLAPITCTTNDAEALSYVEAMDSTKTSSSKVQASAMQTTQRIATNVGSVKALAAAGCLAQLTKAATDANNVDNQKVATAGLAQMTKVALEGFEEAGNDLIVEIMEGVKFFFFFFLFPLYFTILYIVYSM